MSYATSHTISYILYVHLLSRVLSGGLFHWKKGLAYSVDDEKGLQLYHDVPENTLLNDVFFYVLYHLSSFQNMHEYHVTKDTDIFQFVHTSSPAIPGTCVPEIPRISKQLVAYLETLVAFCPYYHAADVRYQGKIENFYRKALERYKDFPYKEFHKYIARKMEAFHKRHGFRTTKGDQAEESEELEDVGAVVPVDAAAEVNRSYAMSDGEDEEDGEGGEGGGAAASDAEDGAAAAAAAAPAPAAAAEAAQA